MVIPQVVERLADGNPVFRLQTGKLASQRTKEPGQYLGGVVAVQKLFCLVQARHELQLSDSFPVGIQTDNIPVETNELGNKGTRTAKIDPGEFPGTIPPFGKEILCPPAFQHQHGLAGTACSDRLLPLEVPLPAPGILENDPSRFSQTIVPVVRRGARHLVQGCRAQFEKHIKHIT